MFETEKHLKSRTFYQFLKKFYQFLKINYQEKINFLSLTMWR